MIFLNFIFQVLNFFVLITVFYYAIQRLIIPAVVKMIELYDIFIQSLKHDRQEVIADYQVILKEIDTQEQQFELMQDKFLAWEKKCQQDRSQRLAEQKKIEQSLQDRFIIRSQVIMNELAIKEQLPYILAQVTEQLQLKYQAAEFQKKYTQDLIDGMKEQL
ncbi:hypothetical protein [Candidatus Chromulinivorax destructor]|uniref:Uncharacterized protein n=1 Tax=Candidatus Chromulinivorax destructor TaxID=2066483 RepID=A0A345ZBB4_9BACT|nr:hypothetical protein [Candidatus Chromulinivorax destructor]AXK60581.1 hypothetical protein C0J27_02380 [Candidatus Chromulinivorax destructor]